MGNNHSSYSSGSDTANQGKRLGKGFRLKRSQVPGRSPVSSESSDPSNSLSSHRRHSSLGEEASAGFSRSISPWPSGTLNSNSSTTFHTSTPSENLMHSSRIKEGGSGSHHLSSLSHPAPEIDVDEARDTLGEVPVPWFDPQQAHAPVKESVSSSPSAHSSTTTLSSSSLPPPSPSPASFLFPSRSLDHDDQSTHSTHGISGVDAESRYTASLAPSYPLSGLEEIEEDTQERNRLNRQHNLLRFVTHRTHVTPYGKQPRMALDLNTGTGVWMREVSEEYPECRFVGVDARPIGVLYHPNEMPINCHYEQADALQGLPHMPSNHFDIINQRFQLFHFPTLQWSPLLETIHRLLRPGTGVMELYETSLYHRPSDVSVSQVPPSCASLNDALETACSTVGIHIRELTSIRGLIAQAGFVKMRERTVQLAVGEWGGEAGQMMKDNVRGILETFRAPVIQLGVCLESEWCEWMRKWEVECEEARMCVDIYIWSARKEEKLPSAPSSVQYPAQADHMNTPSTSPSPASSIRPPQP
ncbi:MAG: S-adenosyl-L-methionine-dependent methyltransferase [Piptocephalis tieghemiana]|nr:MAG: S-adenosyl-L-methionine-dependent methyltransferase [Piptocephalis tieghemiana]